MKILLLGKEGQVGRALQHSLLPLGKLVALGRQEFDLLNFTALYDFLLSQKPDIIINAAAYTAVDKAESNAATAYTLNATVVEILADYAYRHQILLIHYSTDYVFDGKKETAYVEQDTPFPQNIYGCSKQAGEEAILRSGCKAFILRTSWVFSSDGKNFVRTILQLAKTRDTLNVVSDQVGAPTSAKLIADTTALIVEKYFCDSIHPGLYHLTATGKTSWHQFACFLVTRALEKGALLKLSPQYIFPITSEDYPLAAKRPKNSQLATQALAQALNVTFPAWETHAEAVVDQLVLLGETV